MLYDVIKAQYSAGRIDDDVAQALSDAQGRGATDAELYDIVSSAYENGKVDDAAAVEIKSAFKPGSVTAEEQSLVQTIPASTPYQTEGKSAIEIGSELVFPRLSRADEDVYVSNLGKSAGDILSLPGRLLAGSASALGTGAGALLAKAQGADFYPGLGREMANEFMGQMATTSQNPGDPFAESLLKDPTIPLIPLTGGMALGAVKSLGVASPMGGAILGGAIEGGLSGLAGAGMEQRGLEQEAQNILFNTAGGALIGSAGKLLGDVSNRFGRDPALQAQLQTIRQVEDIQASRVPPTLIDDPQALAEFQRMSPEVQKSILVSPDAAMEYADMVKKDAVAAVDGSPMAYQSTYLNEVLPAINQVLNERRAVGKQMGEIEDKYKGQIQYALSDIENAINANFADNFGLNVSFKEVAGKEGEPSKIVPQYSIEGISVKSSSSQVPGDVRELAEDIAENFAEGLPGSVVRRLEKNLNAKMKAPDYYSKYNTTKEQSTSLRNALSDLHEGGLQRTATPEEFQAWKEANDKFAEMSGFTDRIKDNLGKVLDFEYLPNGDISVKATKQGISKMKSLANLGALDIQGVRTFYDELGERVGKDLTNKITRAFASAAAAGDPQAQSLLRQGVSQQDALERIAANTARQGGVANLPSEVVRGTIAKTKQVLSPKEQIQVRMAEKVARSQAPSTGNGSGGNMSNAERDRFLTNYFMKVGAAREATGSAGNALRENQQGKR